MLMQRELWDTLARPHSDVLGFLQQVVQGLEPKIGQRIRV